MEKWQENQLPTQTEQPEHWVMYFDDSLKLEGEKNMGTLDLSKGRPTQVSLTDLLKGLKQ
jgi:hypothetical protein